MPEELEVQLSRLVAQASQQLLAMNKSKAQQAQAQQAAQDPLVQIQQAELAIKTKDAETRMDWMRSGEAKRQKADRDERRAAGERIHTENSYKWTLPRFGALLSEAGFGQQRHWTDEAGEFAVFVAR
jgi:hypothetical protein